MPAVNSLRLQGAPNFRDLGGYATSSGKTVRHDHVFRSGDSSSLTEDDFAKLNRLGPKLIVDLRSNNENKASPWRWPLAADSELIAANIMADMRAGQVNIMEPLLKQRNAQGAREMMLMTYRELPNACGPIISSMFPRIARGDTPLIFHCTYGRDRTGFFAAMLLHALGVPRDTVVADYMKSADYMDLTTANAFTRKSLQSLYQMTLDDDGINVLGPPHLAHIEAALGEVDAKFGSADEYLNGLGISIEVKSALQDRLLQ